MSISSLNGLQVLVVEDEMLIALDLKAMLSGLGCVVMGPVPNSNAALRIAHATPLHGAILDVNLRGRPSFDLADELRRMGVPLIFATGYDESFLPDHLRDVPRITKPIQRAQIAEMMLAAFVPAQACP